MDMQALLKIHFMKLAPARSRRNPSTVESLSPELLYLSMLRYSRFGAVTRKQQQSLKIFNNNYRCSIDQEGNVLEAAHVFLKMYSSPPTSPRALTAPSLHPS